MLRGVGGRELASFPDTGHYLESTQNLRRGGEVGTWVDLAFYTGKVNFS